jgi:2,5-diamino-6-(ribosylamino)-4(3H)-pyrimidinone 5'-phosphate reductase
MNEGDVAGRTRPRVHINCAVSLDGRLAYAGGRRALLSGPADLKRVQELRAASDAILVGIGTILTDDPSLRVHWDLLDRPPGREPLRVVLDSQGRIPPTARVLAVAPNGQRTAVATGVDCSREFPPGVLHFRAGGDRVDLVALLAQLHGRGIASVMVEGGSRVLASFLTEGLFDRLTVYVAPVVIGGVSAPPMAGGPEAVGPAGTVPLHRERVVPMDDGALLEFTPAPRGDTRTTSP